MVAPNDKHTVLKTLFCSALAGNQQDYNRFLQTIAPLLKRIVARRVVASDVEDVVQDILISIHKARHTHDGHRPVLPWVAAIAKFRVHDYLRKHYSQMKHKAIDIMDVQEFLEDVTNAEGHNESIDELLEGVSAHHRRILTLMHVEGYTAKEVGQQMNMNESAVKVAAHRILKKIRKQWIA